jgi:hypothetical protein
MYFVAKKELTAFPLDILFHQVFEAGQRVKDSILGDAKKSHDKVVAERIKAIYADRPDSYEGNVEDEYPFIEPDLDYIKDQVSLAKKEAFSAFAEKYDLKGNALWLLPQLTAFIAKMSTCGYNPSEYSDSFGIDDFHKGIWTLAKHPLRGDIISKQYSSEVRNYSALVPLLLMPHKKFNNVPYSSWSVDGLNKIVDPNLYDAMSFSRDFIVENTKEEILQIREKGLTVATGKTAGTVRNPISTHKVYFLSGDLKKLPWLCQVMLFQIWCAHPSNRTNLMILDWKDWDSMPEPLITTQVTAASDLNKTRSTGFVFKPAKWDD